MLGGSKCTSDCFHWSSVYNRVGTFAVLSIGQPDSNLKAVNAFQILLEFFTFDV